MPPFATSNSWTVSVKDLRWHQICAILICSGVLYAVTLAVYRLSLHPLAKFPGPILARATFKYEFFHDYYNSGTYHSKIEEMHQKYGEIIRCMNWGDCTLNLDTKGPIVRVTPDELHIRDPYYYTKLFVPHAVRKTDMYLRFGQGTGSEGF